MEAVTSLKVQYQRGCIKLWYGASPRCCSFHSCLALICATRNATIHNQPLTWKTDVVIAKQRSLSHISRQMVIFTFIVGVRKACFSTHIIELVTVVQYQSSQRGQISLQKSFRKGNGGIWDLSQISTEPTHWKDGQRIVSVAACTQDRQSQSHQQAWSRVLRKRKASRSMRVRGRDKRRISS